MRLNPSVTEIYSWFQQTSSCLFEKRDRVLGTLADSHEAVFSSMDEFVGMTESEVRSIFDTLEDELESAYVMKIVAAGEAAFRLDFFERARKGKRKRAIYVADIFLKVLNERSPLKIRLEEDIIEVWKKHDPAVQGSVLSAFKGLLKMRHWVAHGRYWVYQGQQYSFQDSFVIVRDAIAECKI